MKLFFTLITLPILLLGMLWEVCTIAFLAGRTLGRNLI